MIESQMKQLKKLIYDFEKSVSEHVSYDHELFPDKEEQLAYLKRLRHKARVLLIENVQRYLEWEG